MRTFSSWNATAVIYLTNRFHVAVRLFSNRSQMTSKCGKNKKVAHEAIAECVTDVLTTFWRLLWSITESDARQHGIYLFSIITKSLFCFKIFQHNVRAGLLPRLCAKKAIWRDLTWSTICTMQNETISLVAMGSKELWLVEKNRATVKPDCSVASRWMKTCSESRIELRNQQILKKMLEKSSQFLSSEQPCEPKSLDVALKITGVEEIPSGNLWLRSN